MPSPSPFSRRGGRTSSYGRVADGGEGDVDGEAPHRSLAGRSPSSSPQAVIEDDPQNFTIDDDESDDEGDRYFPRSPLEIGQRSFDLVQQFVDDDVDEEDDEERGRPNAPPSWQATADAIGVVERAPSHYICPLTLRLMEDPVNDGCGHCFERRAILDWLAYAHVCPISRKPLSPGDLVQNGRLKSLVVQWREDHPRYLATHGTYGEAAGDLLGVTHPNGTHSQFELMLLPQEREVLKLVKARARARQKRRETARCLWTLLVVTSLLVVLVTVLTVLFFNVRLYGPI